MKRISLIVKGEKCLKELLGIKEKKIRRTIESCLDYTEEAAIEYKEKRQQLLDELGKSADDKEQLVSIVNKYCELVDMEEEAKKKNSQIKMLKKELEEEVAEE